MRQNDQKTINLLTGLVRDTAEDMGVKPHEVGYNDLLKSCKERGETKIFDLQGEIRRLGGYSNIRDAQFPRDPTEAESLPVTQFQMTALASFNRKQADIAARETAFLDRLEELSKDLFREKIKPLGFGVSKPSKKTTDGIKRELNVLISDTHFGADLDPAYGTLQYGTVEEARRLSHIVKSACEYKKDYRSETRLRLHLAGDIIQGQLHDQRDGDILAGQVSRGIYLLTRAVQRFAEAFPEVWVDVTFGNHDRFTSRHKERATLEKADGLALVIYSAVKQATLHLKNVKFTIELKPFVTYETFGARCFGTHGDTVLNPGYPGHSVNVKGLEQQFNRINASLPNSEEYKLFFCGHVHVGMLLHMGNGSILITNGALIPPDQYSLSIGAFENSCGQWIWESVPGFVVGDSRFVTVNATHDKDTALDAIIPPWTGF